jgi:hypothetical protein
MFHMYLARPVLLLALAGLPLAVGCQQQSSAPDRQAETGAKTKQVTVAVTGMT